MMMTSDVRFGGNRDVGPSIGKLPSGYSSSTFIENRPSGNFEGIWFPIVTPFRDGCVDFDALQRLTSDLIESGIHGLVVGGTTGEACQLDAYEQESVLLAVLEAAGLNFPVAMGISGSDTRTVAQKARSLGEFNISGFLVSAPSYVRPSQEGIVLHFREIANATDRPIILYNIPSRTGVNIDLATAIALSANAQFVGIKESSGNLAQLAELIGKTPYKVLSGDDAQILTTLSFGGHGAISAAAHIRPDLYVHLYNLVRTGQMEQTRAVFVQLLPMIKLLFSEPNPAPVKAVLAMQGRVHEELRLPMTPVTKTCRLQLEAALGKVMSIPAPRNRIDAVAEPVVMV